MPKHKLSDALLRGDKLGSGAGQTDYWDTLLPGLRRAGFLWWAGRRSW